MPDANKNFIGEDEVIYEIFVGDQNAQTVSKNSRELIELCQKLRQKRRKVLILADIRKLDKVSLSGKQEGVRLMRDLDYDRAAIFGNYFLFKKLVDTIIIATGMGFKVKFFNSYDHAIEWLKQKG